MAETREAISATGVLCGLLPMAPPGASEADGVGDSVERGRVVGIEDVIKDVDGIAVEVLGKSLVDVELELLEDIDVDDAVLDGVLMGTSVIEGIMLLLDEDEESRTTNCQLNLF